MATIETLDTAVRTLALKKVKQHDKIIKDEVVKGAKKQGFTVSVKTIELVSVGLDNKKVEDIRLGKMAMTPNEAEIVLYASEYVNNSDTIDSQEFSWTEERADSWHWELKAGVTFEATKEVKVPLLKGSVSLKVDLSRTWGETHETKKTWHWKATPQIPARSRVLVGAVLKQTAGTVPMTCTVKVDGTVHCKATLVVLGFWDHPKEFDFPLAWLLTDKERTYTTEGVISGASGLDVMIKKDQVPAKNQLPLTAKQQKELPAGLTKREVLPSALSLGPLSLP